MSSHARPEALLCQGHVHNVSSHGETRRRLEAAPRAMAEGAAWANGPFLQVSPSRPFCARQDPQGEGKPMRQCALRPCAWQCRRHSSTFSSIHQRVKSCQAGCICERRHGTHHSGLKTKWSQEAQATALPLLLQHLPLGSLRAQLC